jgi:Lrp/AsnC family leucine-responsive transcriptional regulator
MDEIDLRILSLIQQSARTSNAEIARQVEMAPSAVFARTRRLEDRGVIEGYEARLNPQALGLNLVAFVCVHTEERPGHPDAGQLLAGMPEVQEVYRVAGEDGYLVKVRIADADALGRLLRERINAIPSVRSTKTAIVLQTLKENRQLPIGQPAESARRIRVA